MCIYTHACIYLDSLLIAQFGVYLVRCSVSWPAVLNMCGAILAALAREDARRATKGMRGEIYVYICMYVGLTR